MAIKMRVLYASKKKKIQAFANAIKTQYDLAFNSVDEIPPAYSCDKERIVILAISGKGSLNETVNRFCKELTKLRAQNVALMIDGDQAIADETKQLLTEAGTNVIDEVLFVNGGFPIFGTNPKPEEKTAVFEWVDRVIQNLK